MRILVDWLREFTDVPAAAADLADRLTDIGLEVETVERPADYLEGVIVAEVREARRMKDHPQYTVCEVDAGSRQGIVVTAAPQVRPGSRYAWAPDGSRLPDGPVETETFGGQESEGMLCSSRELGLTDEAHTLLQMPDDQELGSSIVGPLNLDEPILTLDLTPNRSDCLSHLGVARDFAAAEHLDLEVPGKDELPDADQEPSRKVRVEDPEGCSAYYGVEVTGLSRDMESPFPIQSRLLRMGLRPLHPVVDLTNYVMFERGHPLHPFDQDQLEGDVTVRRADEEETFTGLDENKYDVRSDDLVIADETGPRALAGIMGGDRTGMSPRSSGVFLEAAHFEPTGIRSTAQRLGLHTEASQRFERGVDPEGMKPALARMVELLQSVGGQDLTVSEVVEDHGNTIESTNITFNPDEITPTLGLEANRDRAREQLSALGLTVREGKEEGTWDLAVPSWRHDLSRSADILEEIVRLQGYEQIPVDYPGMTLEETPLPDDPTASRLRSTMEAWGFQEVVNFSFVSSEQHQFVGTAPGYVLENPLSQRHQTLRQSLLDGLLETVETNQAEPEPVLRFYEMGTIFRPDGEETCLAWVMTGRPGRQRWDDTPDQLDFYDAKGQCEALLERLGIKQYEFVSDGLPGFNEAESARVRSNSETLARLGRIDPEGFEPDSPLYGVEVYMDRLGTGGGLSYRDFSRHPAVQRDLDLVVPYDQPVGPMKRELASAQWVEDVTVFDVYRGEPLETDEKSVSVTLRFRHAERTLRDNDVNQVQDDLLDRLRNQFGVSLREE